MKERRTDDIIQQLAASAAPVRLLPHPAIRAVGWLAAMLPWLVIAAITFGFRPDFVAQLSEPAFLFQIVFGLVTAFLAAIAAFAMSVPGFGAWRRAALMLMPVVWVVWFAAEALFTAVATPEDAGGWVCLPALLVFGSVPLILLGLMLRRAAPLAPGRTLIFAALAAGALADAATSICHGATSAAHLVWHVAGVLILVAVGAVVAPAALRWRQ